MLIAGDDAHAAKSAAVDPRLRPLAHAVVALLEGSIDRADGSLDMVLVEGALVDLGYDPLTIDLVALARHMEGAHDSVVFHVAERQSARVDLCEVIATHRHLSVDRFYPHDLRAAYEDRGGASVATALSQLVPALADFARYPCPVLLRGDNGLAHMFLHRGGLRVTCAIVDIVKGTTELLDVNDRFLVDIVASARHNVLGGIDEFIALALEISSRPLLAVLVPRAKTPFEDLRDAFLATTLRPATAVCLAGARRNPSVCYALTAADTALAEVFYEAVDHSDAAAMSQVLVASASLSKMGPPSTPPTSDPGGPP